MFEPHPFLIKPSGQVALMAALQNRDMKAFQAALEDPEVDPDYWYGKPYWTTCLQLAAKTEGCEAFVMALLHAGAGNVRSSNRPRPSEAARAFTAERIAKFLEHAVRDDIESGNLDGNLAFPYLNGEDFGPLSAPAGGCMCGAQGERAAVPAAEAGPENGVDHREATESGGGGSGGGGGGGGTDAMSRGEHMVGLWLRDMNRALRDTADYMRRELRALAQSVDQLGERVAAVERAQTHTNDLLALQLKR